MKSTFVPADFEVPLEFEGPGFRLEPLRPEHNQRDHDAWTSSMDHIRATPGFPDGTWPRPMSLTRNREDLVRHAEDFAERTGFTYSVLDGDDVVGCVYIYPSTEPERDAHVQSWVRESRAELDVPLWRVVSDWLASRWPFTTVHYDGRPGA